MTPPEQILLSPEARIKPKPEGPKHLLQVKGDCHPDWMNGFFPKVAAIKRKLRTSEGRRELRQLLEGRIANLLFLEASTRTRTSFDMAANLLGMKTVVTPGSDMTSRVKGETLRNTLLAVLGTRPDIFVLRDADDDAAKIAAELSEKYYGGIPVINAGSGKKHHPSQTQGDHTILWEYECESQGILVTHEEQSPEVLKRCGPESLFSGLTVGIGADVYFSRTARSFAFQTAKYPIQEIIFITDPRLAPPDELKQYLTELRIPFTVTDDLGSALPRVDLLYWGRPQAERFDTETLREEVRRRTPRFQITLERSERMKPEALILHPQPINNDSLEITPDVQYGSKRCITRQQSDIGVPVRMADYLWFLNRPAFESLC